MDTIPYFNLSIKNLEKSPSKTCKRTASESFFRNSSKICFAFAGRSIFFCAIWDITFPTFKPALDANESLLTAVITTPFTF